MTRRRKYRKFTHRGARETFLEALSKAQPVTVACKMAHWYQPDVYRWRKQDPKFAEEWDAALAEGTGMLEQEGIRRALVGRELPVKDKDGNIIGTQLIPPSDTMLIFMLKARKPEVYRETYRHDITNSDNSLITFANAMKLIDRPFGKELLPFNIDEAVEAQIIELKGRPDGSRSSGR